MTMDAFNDINDDEPMSQRSEAMERSISYSPSRTRASWSYQNCSICGSKAIGMNFGAPTCAPCKAFFRRNARRKEILIVACHHTDGDLLEGANFDLDGKSSRYLQIRRCSSCRLRRCFEMGMNEELIRTDEENQRHKQLVDMNRKRRQISQQELELESQLPLPMPIMNTVPTVEVDWLHLSSIICAYDTYCVKSYLEQRTNIFPQADSDEKPTMEYHALILMNITLSLGTFLRSLPAFRSLSRSNRLFLCKHNLRPLIFVNLHELNQSCFSEPWQVALCKTSMENICGPELYRHFLYVEQLAQKLMIADPTVTRLWLIVLFFSTPLFAYYDQPTAVLKVKTKMPFIHLQNAYVTLLWNYLSNRHGFTEAVRIYSNLIHVFLHMLRIGLAINLRLRTEKEFLATHETLEQLTLFAVNDVS